MAGLPLRVSPVLIFDFLCLTNVYMRLIIIVSTVGLPVG